MFEAISGAYPFVEVSQTVECRLTLERLVPQSDGDYLEVFRLSGASPQRVVELADDDGIQPQLLGEDGSEALLEFQMSGEGVAVSLADHGATSGPTSTSARSTTSAANPRRQGRQYI